MYINEPIASTIFFFGRSPLLDIKNKATNQSEQYNYYIANY